MGFNPDDRMVRVDFFKASGKWYTTEAIRWPDEFYKDCLIHFAFAQALRETLGTRLMEGMLAVCLVPYHEHSHPIMLKNWWNAQFTQQAATPE